MFPTDDLGEKLCADYRGHVLSMTKPRSGPSVATTNTNSVGLAVVIGLHAFLVGALIAILK
jgi:hypothetical protein